MRKDTKERKALGHRVRKVRKAIRGDRKVRKDTRGRRAIRARKVHKGTRERKAL